MKIIRKLHNSCCQENVAFFIFIRGKIILEKSKPTGVLLDNATDRMKGFIPKTTDNQKINALMLAQKNCFAKGLTTVTDAGLDKEDILLIDSLQKAGQLQMKVYAMLSPTKENLDYFFLKGPLHEDRLTVSSVKLYADGALVSRGALLLKPYADDPGNTGLQMEPTSYYDSLCRLAFESGFQVNTHPLAIRPTDWCWMFMEPSSKVKTTYAGASNMPK
ncbi:MAG: amidohydrolase family protein [Bacteroidetes bacterium]|nr:amidohydrolase family protein [Bacteroidota bacterium]